MVVVRIIIRILLLPVRMCLTIIQLVVMFFTWLSATVFHILSGIICITAILEKNYIVANLKHSAEAERLRIISEVSPYTTAWNVEPTLEDLYLYYFAEVSDNE